MVAVAVVELSGPVSFEREELAAKIEVESDEEVLDVITIELKLPGGQVGAALCITE